MEVVDSYLTKKERSNIFLCRGSLQDFSCKNQLMKVLMLYVHIKIMKKMRRFLSNMLVWDGQSYDTKNIRPLG